MISSRLVFSGLFIVLVHFFIGSVSGQSGAANNTNATSVTTNLPPATSNITSTTVATPAKNATASDDEEECEDEPEAEGPAKNGTSADRQGKGLIIIQGGDKDKYTHENGTAEPEAESEPGTNSTSSGLNDKLTGGNRNASSASDARGAVSSIYLTSNFVTCVLGLSVASLFHCIRP